MSNILNKLSEEQKDIVFSKDNRVFVNAGAGTGKTHTIVAFVVNLIENENIPPHKIRVLTFTNKASSMMKKRLKKELGKNISKKIKVNTFHSLAYVYMSKLDFLKDRKQADYADFMDIAKSITRQEKCCLTAQELVKQAEKIGRMASYYAIKNKNYKWFVKFYEKLDTKNLWDFDFLFNKMIEKLNGSTAEISKQRNSYEYILVDEYQDCNENQIELLKLLVGKDDKFLFVGDPDQMIYNWRGAKMSYSTEIGKHFKDAKVKNLTINYRSCQNIVKSANKLICNNNDRLPKVITTYKKSKGYVSYKHCDTEENQLNILSEILKNAEGNSAVLCYTNELKKNVAQFLKKRGFAVQVMVEDTKSKIGKNDICVLTCHASKGLEFDNIFIPYLIEYYCGNKEANRRLFYVAITRAKKNLHLFSLKSLYNKSTYIRCKPSKFLEEIGV